MLRKLFSGVAATCVAAAVVIVGTTNMTNANAAETTSCPAGNDSITHVSFTFKDPDGTVRTSATLWNETKPGDDITATFTIAPNCSGVQVSLASYRAPDVVFDPATAPLQELYRSATGTFSSGVHTLEVLVPMTPGTPGVNCPNTFHSNGKSVGANASGPYDTTCDGSPSLNGNSTKNNSNKPCAGCVGNADNKNPKGQLPNAQTDGNNGYECDNNKGVGKSNPAHSGCTTNQHYQVDFVRGSVLTQIGPAGTDNFYTPQGRLLDTDLG